VENSYKENDQWKREEGRGRGKRKRQGKAKKL
jgi:hypothetical protein